MFQIILAFCDSPEALQLSFQDPATPIIEGIINLHDDVIVFLILVFFIVFLCFFTLIFFKAYYKKNNSYYFNPLSHNTFLEFIWTIIPALILVAIAIPSFSLIYSIDDLVSAQFNIKVIGHQWYWSYEYQKAIDTKTEIISPNIEKKIQARVPKILISRFQTVTSIKPVCEDSYIVNEEDLYLGSFRLLEVDNRVRLPIKTHIRVIVTSADVVHSWAIPSLGIKIDACPGRLNQVSTYINRPGVFYGQCSELCGVNHGFIPIVIEGYDTKEISFLKKGSDLKFLKKRHYLELAKKIY